MRAMYEYYACELHVGRPTVKFGVISNVQKDVART